MPRVILVPPSLPACSHLLQHFLRKSEKCGGREVWIPVVAQAAPRLGALVALTQTEKLIGIYRQVGHGSAERLYCLWAKRCISAAFSP